MMISKIELKCFWINLMLDVFKVEIIKIIFKKLLIGCNIFFPNFWSQIFGKFFVVYIFPWICIIFFHFFASKNF